MYQDNIWKKSGEVYNFAWALHAFAQTEKHNDPRQEETSRHGRSNRSSFLDPAADPQNMIARRKEIFF